MGKTKAQVLETIKDHPIATKVLVEIQCSDMRHDQRSAALRAQTRSQRSG